MNVLKSMEIRSGHSEIFIISQVSAVEGCPLSGVPLYYQGKGERGREGERERKRERDRECVREREHCMLIFWWEF